MLKNGNTALTFQYKLINKVLTLFTTLMISLPISQVLITAIMDNLPDAVVYFVPVLAMVIKKAWRILKLYMVIKRLK
jgi:hypothetical protein